VLQLTPETNYCVGSAGGKRSTSNTSWCDIVYSDVVRVMATSDGNQTALLPIVLFTDGLAE
jgi:hypothetical protein